MKIHLKDPDTDDTSCAIVQMLNSSAKFMGLIYNTWSCTAKGESSSHSSSFALSWFALVLMRSAAVCVSRKGSGRGVSSSASKTLKTSSATMAAWSTGTKMSLSPPMAFRSSSASYATR
eukprot:319200-Amphidinium_carterae.1